MFVDTHCHVHEADYPLENSEVVRRAQESDVTKIICVGTNERSSEEAVAYADAYDGAYAAIGVHPHDSKDGYEMIASLAGTSEKIVAVGEIGLDYFYTNSPREVQIAALERQIEVALAYDLPIIFHVRDAFDDFWPIFDAHLGIRGVLHSFTDTKENMEKAVVRGLYIGVNGISTFTKDETQRAMFDAIPLEKMLLETDAPFLTPNPFRGKINEPAFVRIIAEYHAERRGMSLEEIGTMTTRNARALFAL